MSSNLFKAGWVVVNDDTRVINTNDLVEKRVREEAEKKAAAFAPEEESDSEFCEGLEADHVDALLDQEGEEAVLQRASMEAQAQAERARQEAEEKLEQAGQQAQAMLEDAKQEIEAMKAQALQEAQEEGYNAGYNDGMAQTKEMQDACLAKERELEQNYSQMIQELEPTFIETLTGIYEHIFKVDLSGYQSLVTELLIDAMNKAEGARNYMIHVSKDDFAAVSQDKEKIMEETGTMGDHLEIISDMTLSKSQCMIETEGGIYDCSLDTELDELKKKLILISYKK